jgi:acyl carrier protein
MSATTNTTTAQQMRDTMLRILGTIAPEADLAALDPTVSLRDQLDIDSMDFLNFAIALHHEFGVDIPEADYPKFMTLDGATTYLLAASKS